MELKRDVFKSSRNSINVSIRVTLNIKHHEIKVGFLKFTVIRGVDPKICLGFLLGKEFPGIATNPPKIVRLGYS